MYISIYLSIYLSIYIYIYIYTEREHTYTDKGFSLWYKARQCFKEYLQTHCQKIAALYYVVNPECKNVGEVTNDILVNVREKKNYLM